MKRLTIYIILYLLIISCEERIDISMPGGVTSLMIVEGMLTNENKNHLVKLSLPYKKQNGTPEPATGASVWVSDDLTNYPLAESPAGSGSYYTQTMRAVTGKIYTLHVQYQGKEYIARDSPVPVQPLRGLKYIESSEGYRLTPEPEGQDPNYVEHIFSWKNTSSCIAGSSCEGRIIFYDLKTIDVNEIYKPDKELFYFPKQTSVVRRKYSVSDAYRTFLRSMLSETEWRGGVFDVQRSDVPTNLSEGAIGFFAVCSVVSDSTVVQ
jgi:hypothetical protein